MSQSNCVSNRTTYMLMHILYIDSISCGGVNPGIICDWFYLNFNVQDVDVMVDQLQLRTTIKMMKILMGLPYTENSGNIKFKAWNLK